MELINYLEQEKKDLEEKLKKIQLVIETIQDTCKHVDHHNKTTFTKIQSAHRDLFQCSICGYEKYV